MKSRAHELGLIIARFLIYIGIFLLTAWVALPFAAPIILACIVSSLFLELKKHLPALISKNMALYAGLSVFVTLLVIVLPLFFLTLLLGLETFHFVQFLNELLTGRDFASIQQHLSGAEQSLNMLLEPTGVAFSFQEVFMAIGTNIEAAGNFIIENATGILSNLASLALNTFFFLFITFFLVKDGEEIITAFKGLLPFDKEDTQTLVDSVEHVGQTVIIGSMVASIVLGFIMMCVFTAFGFASPVLWGLCISLLSLVPLVGTWFVYIPSIIFLTVMQSWIHGLVFLICIILIENVLFYGVIRPRFLDAKTQLYPLAIFLAIIGGLANFGPIGIVYGPLIMAAFITTMKHLALVQSRKN